MREENLPRVRQSVQGHTKPLPEQADAGHRGTWSPECPGRLRRALKCRADAHILDAVAGEVELDELLELFKSLDLADFVEGEIQNSVQQSRGESKRTAQPGEGEEAGVLYDLKTTAKNN